MSQNDPYLIYLEKRRELHRKALSELDVAERYYRESGIKPHFPMAAADEKTTKPKNAGKKPASKKLMILDIINDGMPQGRSSPKILEIIQGHFIPGFPRRNLAPKLTLYKKDGLLEPGDGVWKITEAGKAFLAKG